MVQSNLFSLTALDFEIKNALQSSIIDFKQSKTNLDFWAKTSLKKHTETALHKAVEKNLVGATTNSNPPTDPIYGFRATFGLQIVIGYKLRYKAIANVGYGQRWGNIATSPSLHLALYNSGLGAGVNKKNIVLDVTAAMNLTIGGGEGTPLQSYTTNYNSPNPILNDFKNSFSYGQLYTWNSALNKNKFSFSDLQRQGMVGFRIGNVNVSTNNDTARFPYFGDGGDWGWTGGISFVTPIMEFGFQDFSGAFIKDAPNERERESLKEKIQQTEDSLSLSREEKEEILIQLKRRLFELTDKNMHTQTKYQQNLNKAATYFRLNKDGYNATIDFIGDAWLQNFIHRQIKDLRFQYDHKKVQVWGGKNW